MTSSPDPEANFADRVKVVFHALAEHHVDCVIIGGVALAAHGSAYLTRDFDVAYLHERENIRRIVAALAPLRNFTLKTDAGDVDILAHVGGFFNYGEIKSMSQAMELYEREMSVLSVEGLIRAKKLEVLLEAEKRQREQP